MTSRPRRETILLVEDEAAVRELAREILASEGYRVLTAGDGAQALILCAGLREPLDLLLTDMVMPGMGGGDLGRRLTALDPHLPVLYMSGYTDDAILRQGVMREREHFLQKPFTLDALVRKVREVLDAEALDDDLPEQLAA